MYKLLIYYLTYEYFVLFHQVKHFHLITDSPRKENKEDLTWN